MPDAGRGPGNSGMMKEAKIVISISDFYFCFPEG